MVQDWNFQQHASAFSLWRVPGACKGRNASFVFVDQSEVGDRHVEERKQRFSCEKKKRLVEIWCLVDSLITMLRWRKSFCRKSIGRWETVQNGRRQCWLWLLTSTVGEGFVVWVLFLVKIWREGWDRRLLRSRSTAVQV